MRSAGTTQESMKEGMKNERRISLEYRINDNVYCWCVECADTSKVLVR